MGPPLGSFLVAVGTGFATLTTAGLYLVAAGALLLLRRRYDPRPTGKAAPAAKPRIRDELAEGLRHLRGHRLLRNLALMVCVMAAAWSGWSAVLVLCAVSPKPMDLSSTAYGILLTARARRRPRLLVTGRSGACSAPAACSPST